MPPALSALLPWTDRSGRLSLLRAAVFVALLVPGLLLAGRAVLGDLGPRPLTEALHVAGDWAARTLVAAIAITPLRQISGQGRLIGVRRMIGLAAFSWALLHVGLWIADLGFDAAKAAVEVLVRPYLGLGAIAFVGLVALGATSTDGMIRRLGGPGWQRLHGLVHPIAILAVVHVFLQSKLDLAQGAILTGIAAGGLAVRLAAERRRRLGVATVAVAAVVAFAGAGAAEAVWFAVKTGRPVGGILAANLMVEARIAPAWIAAAITLAAAAVAFGLRRATEAAGLRRDRPVPAVVGRRDSELPQRQPRVS